MLNGSAPAILQEIYTLLPRHRQRQLLTLLSGGVVLAFVEMASVASLAAMASVISNPNALLESGYLSAAKPLHDLLTGLEHQTLILATGGLALALLLVKNALAAGIAYANATVGALIDAHFGDLVLQNILARPYVWFLGQNSADLFTVAGWRRHVGSGLLFMAVQTLCDVMVISLLLLGLLVASPGISALLLVGAGLAGAGVFRVFRSSSMRVGQRLKELETVVNRGLTTMLRGAKEVKIFAAADVFQRRFVAASERYARCEGMYRLLQRLPSLAFEVLGFSILLSAIAVFLLLNRDAPPSAVLGFLTLLTVAAWRILNAVNRVLSSMSAIRLDMPPTVKVLRLLEERPAAAAAAPDAPPAFDREIRLDGLGFTYPGASRPALRDLHLTIPKGLCLGLVGRSGAGKSTFVDLLIGLLSPTSGTLAVDGKPVTAENAPAWMRRVGYVGQTPYLLDATLRENIAFGVPAAAVDDDHVRECCRLALVDEFLPSLPQGLDTPLGEGGGNLSGGQRQRVAIARALYRRPELLILDEATSALDMQSENALRRTVQELTGRYTLVIIAHRLTAVEPCQALLWLDQGAVKAFGARDEILDRYTRAMGDAAV